MKGFLQMHYLQVNDNLIVSLYRFSSVGELPNIEVYDRDGHDKVCAYILA